MSNDVVLTPFKNVAKEPNLLEIKENTTINDDQILKLTSFKDPDDDRDYKFSSKFENFNDEILSLSSEVDHSNLMSSVKDQGNLGSCVSFALSAMKEWQEKKEQLDEVESGKKYIKEGEYNYSESWIYWNCKKIDEWPGEEGTSIRYAMKVLNKLGVPTEKAWPYSDTIIGEPAKWAPMIAKWAWIAEYWRIESLEELKLALKSGPVPIAIPCFEEIFFVRQDGVVRYPYNPSIYYGGHAICAVGYSDSSKLIKFKNSWGPTWGDNGYGYISYQYAIDFLWDAWACNDIQVTRDMLKETRNLL